MTDFKSDVNVGGPDGDQITVGTVIVPYAEGASREWLWRELDKVRRHYEEQWFPSY